MSSEDVRRFRSQAKNFLAVTRKVRSRLVLWLEHVLVYAMPGMTQHNHHHLQCWQLRYIDSFHGDLGCIGSFGGRTEDGQRLDNEYRNCRHRIHIESVIGCTREPANPSTYMLCGNVGVSASSATSVSAAADAAAIHPCVLVPVQQCSSLFCHAIQLARCGRVGASSVFRR